MGKGLGGNGESSPKASSEMGMMAVSGHISQSQDRSALESASGALNLLVVLCWPRPFWMSVTETHLFFFFFFFCGFLFFWVLFRAT